MPRTKPPERKWTAGPVTIITRGTPFPYMCMDCGARDIVDTREHDKVCPNPHDNYKTYNPATE